MQDMAPQLKDSLQLIQRYGDGGFVISEKPMQGAVMVWREQAKLWEGVNSAEEITPESLAAVLTSDAQPIEFLLLGTGKEMRPVSAELRQLLREKKIGLEVMDTGAACRTFNILLSEERRVVAALLPV